MIRAFLYGIAVLVALDVLCFGTLVFWPSPVIALVANYGGSFLASLITAYNAPHDRIFTGIMIALPAVLLQQALSAAYEATGAPVDAVGPTGEIILFSLSLTFSVFFCTCGGILGNLLAAQRSQLR